MKQLCAWLLVIAVLSVVVFSGALVRFDHFWQAWEFLAAATATLHNLFFAVVVYALRKESGEGTLHDALADNRAITIHLLLRVSLPTLFFFGTTMVVLWDRQIGSAPVPDHSVLCKLVLTFLAFATVWIGDLVTQHQLGGIVHKDYSSPRGWVGYFRMRAWLIDLPFVFGYAGLICIYIFYRYDATGAQRPAEQALLLQAFVGGASALEMMIQSAIHGFSEVADYVPAVSS